MIRNIGKLRQWTGGKMGKTCLVDLDDDFNAIQSETEATRETLEILSETSESYLKAISKRFDAVDKYKGLAIETFGMSMSAQAHVLPECSVYRNALFQMGDAHQKIGAAQSEMISRFAGSYIVCLEKERVLMKEYQHMQRKLLSRRMDYDAKLAKVYKARKEKPEWEEEMQSAKAKYENARESVLDMMMSIIELQDENVHNLKIYYDALLAYARKSVAILEAIPESVFVTQIHESPTSCHLSPHPSMPPNPPHPSHISTSPHPSHISTSPRPPHISTSPHPSSPHPPPLYTSSHVSSPRPISPHHYALPHLSTSPHPSSPHAPYSPRVARRSWYDTDDESSAHSDNRSEARVSTSRRRNRASSVSDMHRQSITRPPLGPSRSISHSLPTRRHSTMHSTIAQPPTLPDRPSQYRQVRAIYNFEATAEDELSLHKGDLIRIIEEIDHGWWEGESFDSHGVKHEGMFPSNYVEEVPLGTCFEGVCSSSESNRSSIEDEEAYYLRDCNNNMYGEIESGQEPPPEVHAVNIPAARRAPSISSQYSNVPVEAGMAHPIGRPTSRSHPLSLSCHKPGVRAPPPPPRRANSDLSRNNNALHQTPDSPRMSSPSPMSSNNSGMGYVPRD